MAYSEFTLDEIKKTFQLVINERTDMFAQVSPVEPGSPLSILLPEYIPLALAINTEKARSEMMIAPLLVELRQLAHQEISLFSGVEFNVDAAQGLNGVCDFIVSNDTEQLYITAPIIIVVEAKNENIKAGLPQCMAAMFAARLFNSRQEQPLEPLHGVVTTGNIWKFLRLAGNTVYIDTVEYHIAHPGKILGILLSMLPQRVPMVS